MLKYARNSRNAAEKGLKRTNHWAAYYFTNPKSWYAVPERAMILSAIPVITCTDGTRERTEDEGLGANIWCCSASAFCQTGDNNGKRWNSPIVPLSERNLARWTGQPRTLWPRGVARKGRRGSWDVRVRFLKWWWRIGRRRDRMWRWRESICRKRGKFSARKSFSLWKKYSLQQQNFVSLIFLYVPFYGTMGLPSPFFYAFVDIAIRFFDTDLSLLMRFSVIEVKQKEVVTVTNVGYSCKTSKTSKMNSNIFLVKNTYAWR